jgi:LPS-assembly lipoprotein
MKVRLLLIYFLLLTTACGFHLRGSQTTKINIDNIFITGGSALAKEVKSQFLNAGTSFAASSQEASYVITLKESRFEKSVLSVSPTTGKVEEYQVVFQAKMDAIRADGTYIIENEKIMVIRDFAFDENAVLGEFSEESIIQEDLVRHAANQVLRRLQALLSSPK